MENQKFRSVKLEIQNFLVEIQTKKIVLYRIIELNLNIQIHRSAQWAKNGKIVQYVWCFLKKFPHSVGSSGARSVLKKIIKKR